MRRKVAPKTDVPVANWQHFFRDRIEAAPFVPYDLDFDLQSPEIRAHLSKRAYLDFYGKSGGEFWARLSMRLQPKVIVEIGTGFGLRTNLIGKLNPQAELISFDTLSPYPLNDLRVETGYIARLNRTPFEFRHSPARGILTEPLNLCFIDGSHDAAQVASDTSWAWGNRDLPRFCIVWDDYPLPGVEAAVRGLCEAQGLTLRFAGGMAWVGSEDWLAV